MAIAVSTTLTLSCPEDFSLEETLFCGQCFRFAREGEKFTGIAGNRAITVWKEGSVLYLEDCLEEDLPFWREYFDLARDYGALKALFSQDPVLKEACQYAPGIRVLRQEPWEALCSFILSQNNNIKRITGIIDRLCSYFGEPIPGHPGRYAFPSARRLAGLNLEDLAPLRAGFRAKYILDAARKIADHTVNLSEIPGLPLCEARKKLMEIKGVGIKVADCALLYGFSKTDAFPTDTWIKKCMERYYPQGFPPAFFPYQGIAQQFLFHYIRHISLDKSN